MADTRTKVEKLRAMAAQTASPREAEAAQLILRRLDRVEPALTEDELERLSRAYDEWRRSFAAGMRANAAAAAMAAATMREMLENPPEPVAQGALRPLHQACGFRHYPSEPCRTSTMRTVVHR